VTPTSESRFCAAISPRWIMSEGGITKLDAARRQLDCAIWLRLMDMDSLAIHTLAYAAYGILRDLCHDRCEVMEMVDAIIDHTKFAKVPTFLKHAEWDPQEMLDAHSPESVHLTLVLAIRLWNELGGKETSAMRDFSQFPNPYKPEHKASEAIAFLQDSPPLADQDEATRRANLQRILNSPSTRSGVGTHDRRGIGLLVDCRHASSIRDTAPIVVHTFRGLVFGCRRHVVSRRHVPLPRP
jgi:hypothetical protein